MDRLSLTDPVSTYMEVNDRMIPIVQKPVSAELDLAKTLSLRGVHLDHAFGGLRETWRGSCYHLDEGRWGVYFADSR